MTKDEALNIAIDYMNERLEEHDSKFQRHPATEAERNNILADIEAVKEALAQQNEFKPDWDEKLALTEEVIRLSKRIEELEAQPEQEPVATDWERIARVQDAKLRAMCNEAGGFEKLCEVMDKYERTTPPQRKPLTDEEIGSCIDEVNLTSQYGHHHFGWHKQFALAIEAKLRSKNNV